MTGAVTGPPFLVALNLTRRCNLHCSHCYMDASVRLSGGPSELSTAEVRILLDQIAALSGETMVVLTGGEPLLRRDLEMLSGHASSLGLMTVVGTNGLLLDSRKVAGLQVAGVNAFGISLDSLDSSRHDRFRGLPGAWRAALAGIDCCRRAGMMFQLHFTVTDNNTDELDGMIAFARDAGAAVLNVFFVVCTGRGRGITNISAASYEAVLQRLVAAARAEEDLLVRARCAPHFKRLVREADPPLPAAVAGACEAGGCLAGRRYCRVTPEGEVTPCPYMDISAGSIRDKSLAQLWSEAPLFAALRSPSLEGRCGICEYAATCGGCRARPLARDGNLMGEDFLCAYQPGATAAPGSLPTAELSLQWSGEAEARLKHIPPFVRRFVRQRVEDYARGQGDELITAAHLQTLLHRRFSEAKSALPQRPERP